MELFFSSSFSVPLYLPPKTLSQTYSCVCVCVLLVFSSLYDLVLFDVAVVSSIRLKRVLFIVGCVIYLR